MRISSPAGISPRIIIRTQNMISPPKTGPRGSSWSIPKPAPAGPGRCCKPAGPGNPNPCSAARPKNQTWISIFSSANRPQKSCLNLPAWIFRPWPRTPKNTRQRRPNWVLRRMPAIPAKSVNINPKMLLPKFKGSEAPEECVIYTAHWDHVGVNDTLDGDQIFNGAVDNATGTAAMIELAEAYSQLKTPPRRSVYMWPQRRKKKDCSAPNIWWKIRSARRKILLRS